MYQGVTDLSLFRLKSEAEATAEAARRKLDDLRQQQENTEALVREGEEIIRNTTLKTKQIYEDTTDYAKQRVLEKKNNVQDLIDTLQSKNSEIQELEDNAERLMGDAQEKLDALVEARDSLRSAEESNDPSAIEAAQQVSRPTYYSKYPGGNMYLIFPRNSEIIN